MAWYDDFLAAWDTHDADLIASFMTPDATYADVPLGQTHAGRDAIVAWINSIVNEFSTDYRFEPGFAFATDDAYSIEWVMKDTNDRGAIFPATGRPYAIHGVSVGELEGGKIKRNTDYWSLAEFLMQVGLMAAPEAAAAAG